MAVDKKARGSLLRFVVLRRDRPTRWSWEGPDPALLAAAYASISDRRRVESDAMPNVYVLNGPEPGRLGTPRARGLRQRRPTPTSPPTASPPPSARAEVDVRQTDDEAELIGWLHAAPDERRAGGAQPRRVHALLVRAARRLRACCTRRWSRCTFNPAAREEFRHTSVIAGVADGHDRRLRARLLPARAARGRAALAADRGGDRRRAPRARRDRVRALAPTTCGRRASRHRTCQRPLPDRVHRQQRRRSCWVRRRCGDLLGTDGRYVDQAAAEAPDLPTLIDRDTAAAVARRGGRRTAVSRRVDA